MYPTDNRRILEYPTSYTFHIKCEDSISSSSYLEIIFPSDFQILDSSNCNATNLYNRYYSCTSSSSKSTITLKNLSQNTISAGSSLIFTVDKIRNPGILDRLNPIIVNMRNTATIINTGKYIFPMKYFTYSSVNVFTFTLSSYVAGKSNVNYKFTVKPLSWVSQGSTVELTLPDEVGIANE